MLGWKSASAPTFPRREQMATEVLLSATQMAKLLDLKISNADLWVAPDSLGSAEIHSPAASHYLSARPRSQPFATFFT
jgi:hypothetical protein